MYFNHRNILHHVLLSFPTRRSSDLEPRARVHAALSGASERAASNRLSKPAHRGPAASRVGAGVSRNGAGFERRFEARSEEHTSALQSHSDLVCRVLLENKKIWIMSA